MNTDRDSKPIKVYSEEEDINGPPLDERKPSALDKKESKSREEAAKAIASLQEKAVEDTATEEDAKPPNKADQSQQQGKETVEETFHPRKDQPRVSKRKEEAINKTQTKKQRASTGGSRCKGLSTVLPPNKTQKHGKKMRKHQNNDIPDVEDDYKGPQETPQRQPRETGIMCHAGLLCHLEDINVVLQGKGFNGSVCCKCHYAFHHVCLFVFEGDMYCLNCYKDNVVSQCCTETLFEDLLLSKEMATAAQTGPKHTASELVKFVDNYLKLHSLDMTMKEYLKWRKEGHQYARKKPVHKKQWNKAEINERKMIMAKFAFKNEKYEKVIKLAKEEWLLSTDGVVKALRYKAKDKQFVAAVHYKKGTMVKEQEMTVTDNWVIDTYGKELANKLIDHEEHQEFIKPVDEDGMLAMLKLDDCIITRVKYHPPKYLHKKDERGNDHVTNEVHAKGIWKGLLEDGTVLPLQEEVVTGQFGCRFVEECKRLGTRKFVPIPVGSCRSSVMTLFPKLRCEKAPPVKFMQGQIDRCVFSSLASAFDHTAIPDLVRVAGILQDKSNRLSGGGRCVHMDMHIVTENVKWLQPKRLPKTFNWENDINDYMFVVGVIQDSTNSCQHAVTIFRNWIYDSNEPFALPLSKESLDCCTWDIKDGVIDDASLFVRFSDGWIFKEHETKKKKALDMCAPAMNVKQA